MPFSKKSPYQVVPRSLEMSPYLEPPASLIKSVSFSKSLKHGTGNSHRLKPNMKFGNREDQSSSNTELRKLGAFGNARERGFCYDLSDHDTAEEGSKMRKENTNAQKSRMILLPFEIDQLIEKLGIVDDAASIMSKKFGTVEIPPDDETVGSDCLGDPLFYDDYSCRDANEEQIGIPFPNERDANECTDKVSSSLPELSITKTFEPNYEVISSVSDLRMLERNKEILSVLPELSSVKSGGTSRSSNSEKRKQSFHIVDKPLPSDVFMLPRIEQTSHERDTALYAELKSKRALINDNPFERICDNIHDRGDDAYNDEIFEAGEDGEGSDVGEEQEERAFLDHFETADNVESESISGNDRHDLEGTSQDIEVLSDNDGVEEEEMMFQQLQRLKYR